MAGRTVYTALLTGLTVALAAVGVAMAPRMHPRAPVPTPSLEVLEVAPEPVPEVVAELPQDLSSPLLDPSRFAATRAPERFSVRFETTEGPFVVEIHRYWAPLGADRLYELVTAGFYDGTSFFRVIDDFVVQWGIHPSPAISAAWREASLQDDPRVTSNKRGTLVFATAGPNTRTTQLYINLQDNPFLDNMNFAPLGTVTSGMDVVDHLYAGYGEGGPRGRGPNQNNIQSLGQAYLNEFPELDRILQARVVEVTISPLPLPAASP